MSISEGWCVEAVCDRCDVRIYTPYRATVRSANAIAQMGWTVEGRKTYCPKCSHLRAAARKGEAAKRQCYWRKPQRKP